MTTSQVKTLPKLFVKEPPPPRRNWLHVMASTGQLIAALLVTVAFLAYLLVAPAEKGAPPTDVAGAPAEPVKVVGPRSIWVQPDSPLAKRLGSQPLLTKRINDPTLVVTGTVVASLRQGKGKGNDYWQFNSPELLTTFTDWQKSAADITFAETQLARIRELADTRLDAQRKVVERLRKLVDAGTDTPKDLAAEQTNLLQYQIQGQKEVHEAETAVRLARRSEAALARQLQQAGLEPDLLLKITSDLDVVMADVPEAFLTRVRVDQGCAARFFGLPNDVFTGKVNSIAPVISKERRSLRVLFVVHDPKDQLYAGMFAEIGLDTDPRDALLVPADAVLHLGGSDYTLTAENDQGNWQVRSVRAGRPRNGQVEILDGLKAGDMVMDQGAILLKPLVQKSLEAASKAHANKLAAGDADTDVTASAFTNVLPEAHR